MSKNRIRVLLSLVMLLIAGGAIALFIATQNVRNAPLTVGSGDNSLSDAEVMTTVDRTSDAESDMLIMCDSLPGEIAFNSNQAGTWDILLMDENMNITNLTIETDDDAATDFFPSWSLAGTHLNFLSSRLDATELGPSQITLETGELLSMDILQAILITFQNGLFDWDPMYAPGGEKLLWSSLRDLNLELYMIDNDAEFDISNAIRLTNRGARDWFASWSPDGAQVIFNSNEASDIENIHLLTIDGSQTTALTANEWDTFRGMWSLDGKHILYVLDENDILPQGQLNLYTMNSDGTEQQPLSEEDVFEGGATWTADGSYLVYMSNAEGIWRLLLRDTASGQDCYVTDDTGDAMYPVWRP
ncbi:MAG: TolB family protein [Aggregatilineales bacterium]